MNPTSTRDIAVLGITLEVAGESLCNLLAFTLYGAADLPIEISFMIRSAVYFTCLAVLPRLRRRVQCNHPPEKQP
jgi:hypothetical protein